MIQKIKENIWQMNFTEFGSCVYLVKLKEKNILIDTGSPQNIEELKNDLKELNLTPRDIDIVILTHNHWDHTGGIISFLNSKIYGDKQDFKDEKILDVNELKIKEIEIIKTPGHTKGSISLVYQDVLFSGDTLFHDGIGRTDLPTSIPEKMQESLEKLQKINYKILCPGHI